ncbi:MAG: M23 family metallopeptidase [Candidatus Levybacteria bacterium]|nr:M23 family metallopeptidase [Candidatus Levybacteria bacterium]
MKDNSWLKTFSIGFVIVSFGITLAIVGFLLTNSKNQSTQKSVSRATDDLPPLLLKSIGVNLDYYDPKTNKAGDFVFTKERLEFDSLFMNYGFVIPASSAGGDKSNPQPTFIVPLGTPARSLVDGIVIAIPTLWSGDYSIQVTANGKMEKWIYETEHVRNPKVKVGDKVQAGQIIAEVGNFGNNAPAGFGVVEIGILKGGNTPYHVCPFLYLDPSIKEDIYAKLRAFYRAWNNYKGKTIYNESSYSVPGCLTLNPIEG